MARALHRESLNMLHLPCATIVPTPVHMTSLPLLPRNKYKNPLPPRRHQVTSLLRLLYKPQILPLSMSMELVANLQRARTCTMQLLLLSLLSNLIHILLKQLMLKILTHMPSSLTKLKHAHSTLSMPEDRVELVVLAIIMLGVH